MYPFGFIIEPSNYFYTANYFLSIVVTLLFFIYCQRKYKYPLITLLVIVFTTQVFFLTGSRIYTFSQSDLMGWMNGLALPQTASKSGLGGALFALVSLAIMWFWFGYDKKLLDHFAFVFVVAFGLQKLGCLWAGCCYGTPTQMPWGIQYSAGGQLIHPSQAYESFALFTTAALLLWLDNKRLFRGRHLFVTAIVYGTARFFIEFTKDVTGPTWFGISYHQWVILLIIISLVIIFSLSKSSWHHSVWQEAPAWKITVWLGVLCIILTTTFSFFNSFEIIRISFLILASLGVLMYWVIQRQKNKFCRILILGSAFLFVLITSQTITKDSEKEKYVDISLGSNWGNFFNEVAYNPHQGGCGTAYDRQDYKQIYFAAGGGVKFSTKIDHIINSYGIDGFVGSLSDAKIYVNTNIPKSSSYYRTTSLDEMLIVGIKPYYEFENTKSVSVKIGLQMGSMRYQYIDQETESVTTTHGTFWTPLYPDIELVVGPPDKAFFGEVNFSSVMPAYSPNIAISTQIGTSLGLKDFRFSIGLGEPGNYFIARTQVPIRNFKVGFFYAGGKYDGLNSGFFDDLKNRNYGFKVSYRLNQANSRK